MDLLSVIIFAALLTVLYLFAIRYLNSRQPEKERPFEQAGVKVSFSKGTIAIDNCVYDVNQVTGVRINPYLSAQEYHDSKGEKVFIEIDDFKKPTYQISFVTSAQAEQFLQRLIIALKRAGSPKVI